MRPDGAPTGRPGSDGNPMACAVASTRSPALSVGYRLAGGSVPFMTQLRKCARMAFTVWVCGIGLAGNTPWPYPALGQAGGAAATVLNPPGPPPCCVLGI